MGCAAQTEFGRTGCRIQSWRAVLPTSFLRRRLMSTIEAPRTPRFTALDAGGLTARPLNSCRSANRPRRGRASRGHRRRRPDPVRRTADPDACADLVHRLLARRHADRRRHPGGRRRQQGTPRLGRRHRSRRLPDHHPEHLLWRRCLFARRQVARDGRFRRSHPASRRRQRPRHPSAQRIHLRGRYARLFARRQNPRGGQS